MAMRIALSKKIPYKNHALERERALFNVTRSTTLEDQEEFDRFSFEFLAGTLYI